MSHILAGSDAELGIDRDEQQHQGVVETTWLGKHVGTGWLQCGPGARQEMGAVTPGLSPENGIPGLRYDKHHTMEPGGPDSERSLRLQSGKTKTAWSSRAAGLAFVNELRLRGHGGRRFNLVFGGSTPKQDTIILW